MRFEEAKSKNVPARLETAREPGQLRWHGAAIPEGNEPNWFLRRSRLSAVKALAITAQQLWVKLIKPPQYHRKQSMCNTDITESCSATFFILVLVLHTKQYELTLRMVRLFLG